MNHNTAGLRLRHGATAVAAIALLLAGSTRVHAQDGDRKACTVDTVRAELVDVADAAAMRVRLRQLQGVDAVTSLAIRRPSLERAAGACVWAADRSGGTAVPLPFRLRTTYNSAYPLDTNNGAMWSGRGLTIAASGGGEVSIGPLSAGFYPVIAFHQNREFALKDRGPDDRFPFRYAGHGGIDWPQRHGREDYVAVDPGQSYVRLEGFGATIGVSTENLWLGPALRMPLIMGSSAPGFPHIFIGSARPFNIYIGSLEAQAFWGRLTESEYFDDDPDNNNTLLAGLSVVFEPGFARGLFLGVNRMYLARMDGFDFSRYFIDPYVEVRDNPEGDNQLFSLYARWVLPAAGFEVWAEWAREDHWGDWIDLLREPDHSQAYMLGFQKTGTWRGAELRWFGELAHLQSALTLRGGRPAVTFYTHSEIRQGYTHRGQLLGAWIGPGSDAQILGVERSTPQRTTGLTIERIRFDADAYYNQWARFYGQNGHDVSLGATIAHREQVGPVTVHAGLGAARRHNRNFVYLRGEQPPDFRAETNVQFDLDLRWSPRVW